MRKLLSNLQEIFSKKKKLKNDEEISNDSFSLDILPEQSSLPNLSTQQLLKNYLDFIFAPENRLRITTASILTIVITIFSILAPYYLGLIIASLNDHKKEGENSAKDSAIAIETIITIVLVNAIAPLLSNARDQLLAPFGAHNAKKLLRQIVRKQIHDQSLGSHVESAQSANSYLMQKGYAVSQIGTPVLTRIAPKFLELLIASTALTFNYGASMGVGVLALSAVFTIYCAKTIKPLIAADTNMLNIGGKSWGKMHAAVSQYKVLHDCGKSDEILAEIDALTEEAAQAEINVVNTPLKINAGHILIANIGVFFMLLSQREKIAPANFSILFSYLIQLALSMPSVGQALNEVFAKYPNLKSVFEALAKPPEIIDTGTESLMLNQGAHIRFENIRFSYPGKPLTFENLTLDIPKGQIVAIVSDSGVGKSTLFNLLFRYYSPKSGRITINDQEISDIKLKELRDNIIMVEQTPNLSAGTIRENIVFGAKDRAAMTDEMIYELAEKLKLKKFICALTKEKTVDIETFKRGLDIHVGNGKKLSGGQQQKISILRGFAKEAPIRLLDEITASLDPRSARKIMTAVRKTSNENTTTLIITHKLAEIEFADQIFILKEGCVYAKGTHNELLNNCELYSSILAKEDSSSEEDAASVNVLACVR